MFSISRFAFLLCAWIITSASASIPIPKYFQPFPTTRYSLNSTQVQLELGGHLSNKTSIFGPYDPRFAKATKRWNIFAVPRIQLVIEPGEESDVPTIVQYCNENSLEFLAINSAHGTTQSIASFDGVQINLVKLNHITIDPSGESAWFGGGVSSGHVSRFLWDRGYVTTTGSCDCVGLLGPGLGGGHGRHEGLYGMVSDNFRQLNVVLADGTSIRVNDSSYEDLFWGLKGAGHNFGIVTSVQMNIFPRGPDTWHYHNYIWRGDQLETVFDALNTFHGNGSTPVNMATNHGNFLMNPAITTDEPVIAWFFAYRGTAEAAEKLLAPFNAIPAAYSESGDRPYPEISIVQQTHDTQPVCQGQNVYIPSTAGLQVYNVTAERQIYEGYRRRVESHPVLAAGAFIMHEGYSTEAVDAHDPDDSAYPFRADHHLMLFEVLVPESHPEMEIDAREWAEEVRDLWNEGQPGRNVHAYVNYANGGETLQQMYGHEEWRLERLRGLKEKYDPDNRFRYYNPIVRNS